MSDVLTTEQRSRNMSAIRSKDTKPELYIRKLLFSCGYRYRKNYKKIPGHPDIFLPKYRTAIFVNGCFWHRHKGCKYASMPSTRTEYWTAKFEANIKRDERNRSVLSALGIRTLIVWECTANKMKRDKELETETLKTIEEFIRDGIDYLEI